ncbi:ExbD/TolR family protein [Parvicella tangerina]|uniref:Tol-Pal system protein TolR n=1 Tax=Parvicella tangerina TaxID=2829795 RepID=A0A916JL70_9FLAO|nr:biopolymer transporter ExbD [Parvicella tangerina]CAG5080446.1 Tol-Pal system protein TolR [Parvicella tangerina]
MRNLRSNNKIKAEGGTSAMTDLVFLLLIFFIILTTLISPPNIELELPSANPTKPDEKPEVVKVSVAADNQFYVGDEGNLVTKEELESTIMNQVLMTGDSIVELSGDKTSSWESNVAVIDIAKKNQLKIVIKTKL